MREEYIRKLKDTDAAEIKADIACHDCGELSKLFFVKESTGYCESCWGEEYYLIVRCPQGHWEEVSIYGAWW